MPTRSHRRCRMDSGRSPCTGRTFSSKNPINRFSIGDRTPGLARNPDGSLDIYIRSQAPKDHEINWLPSPPSGQLRLNYRTYLPAAEAKDPTTLVKYLPPIKKVQ